VAIVLTVGDPSLSETMIMTISKTNLWAPPTIFGLTPTLFYGITGASSAAVIGAAAFMIVRFRRYGT